MKTLAILLLATSPSTLACSSEVDEPAVPDASARPSTVEDDAALALHSEPRLAPVTIDVRDAVLAGDLGDYTDFVALAREWSVLVLSNGAQIEIHGGDGYWVMGRIFFRGGLAHPDLVPGAHIELGPRDWNASPEELQVGVTGCAGPSRGAWTFDSVAVGLSIDVEEGGAVDERVLHFAATFDRDDFTQVLGGSFTYTVRGAES